MIIIIIIIIIILYIDILHLVNKVHSILLGKVAEFDDAIKKLSPVRQLLDEVHSLVILSHLRRV